MSSDVAGRIAETVLYEGYLLWPYRRSAIKNRRRWTFGAVHPPAWSARHADDAPAMRTQCLLQSSEGAADLDVSVRFLHVVDRRVAEVGPGGPRFVDVLEAGGERHVAWEEATEREVSVPAGVSEAPIRVPAGAERERVAAGRGLVERSWAALQGRVEVRSEALAADLHRLTVTILNTSPWDGEDRADALRHAFISTHTVLHTGRGAFVSLLDPPEELAEAAAACANTGTYPVLVGRPGERTTMLSSPIILYDHPEIAPESPGDLFDATEIDQLLILSVLSMSEEEQRDARSSDPRAAEILDRCASLGDDEMLRLNGAIRELRIRDGAP
jgi:hydrogenase maturation protease